MTDKCPNSLLGAHKFEPRYDLGPADLSRFDNISGGWGVVEFAEKFRAKTYIHDICVRCGKTINRGQ